MSANSNAGTGFISDIEKLVDEGYKDHLQVEIRDTYIAGGYNRYGYIAVMLIIDPYRYNGQIRNIKYVQKVIYCSQKLFMGDMIKSQGAKELTLIESIL